MKNQRQRSKKPKNGKNTKTKKIKKNYKNKNLVNPGNAWSQPQEEEKGVTVQTLFHFWCKKKQLVATVDFLKEIPTKYFKIFILVLMGT